MTFQVNQQYISAVISFFRSFVSLLSHVIVLCTKTKVCGPFVKNARFVLVSFCF
jgi:hypothetical protein